MKNDFINVEHMIPITGKYNRAVYDCKNCNLDISETLFEECLGFSNTNIGLMMIVECPRCFSHWYFHCHETTYEIFLSRLHKNKHYIKF